jgi:hypothetical protein
MCWVLAQQHGNELVVFDEIKLRNTNTQKTLDHLYKKHGEHMGGWGFYGDATGRHKRTSAVSTDYIQIRNDRRFDVPRVKEIKYPQKNPSLLNRFAACNALFKNAKGEVRCRIHPRCVGLIRDLQVRAYEEGTRFPDDALDVGHFSDALGYLIYKLFPVRASMFSSDMPQSKIIVRS